MENGNTPPYVYSLKYSSVKKLFISSPNCLFSTLSRRFHIVGVFSLAGHSIVTRPASLGLLASEKQTPSRSRQQPSSSLSYRSRWPSLLGLSLSGTSMVNVNYTTLTTTRTDGPCTSTTTLEAQNMALGLEEAWGIQMITELQRQLASITLCGKVVCLKARTTIQLSRVMKRRRMCRIHRSYLPTCLDFCERHPSFLFDWALPWLYDRHRLFLFDSWALPWLYDRHRLFLFDCWALPWFYKRHRSFLFGCWALPWCFLTPPLIFIRLSVAIVSWFHHTF